MSSPFKIRYRGCDGSDTKAFTTLGQVARYLDARDQGSDYRRPGYLQGEFAQFHFEGFTWSDLLGGSAYDHRTKYKPDLLANIILRFGERKYENRAHIARWWNAKDGPDTVGEIHQMAVATTPGKPFQPVMDDRKRGPAMESLAAAKQWVDGEYRKRFTSAEPVAAPATDAVGGVFDRD